MVVIGLPITAGVVIAISVDTPVGIVIAVLGGVLGLVAAVFLYTRYLLLAAPVLVLEERGRCSPRWRGPVSSPRQ